MPSGSNFAPSLRREDFDVQLRRILAHYTVQIPRDAQGNFPRDVADAVYSELVADKWTLPQLRWCVSRMIRRPDMLRFTQMVGMLTACLSGDPVHPSGQFRESWYRSDEFRVIQAKLEHARQRLADENSEPMSEDQLKTLEEFGAHVIAAQLRTRYRGKDKLRSVGSVLGTAGMGGCST